MTEWLLSLGVLPALLSAPQAIDARAAVLERQKTLLIELLQAEYKLPAKFDAQLRRRSLDEDRPSPLYSNQNYKNCVVHFNTSPHAQRFLSRFVSNDPALQAQGGLSDQAALFLIAHEVAHCLYGVAEQLRLPGYQSQYKSFAGQTLSTKAKTERTLHEETFADAFGLLMSFEVYGYSADLTRQLLQFRGEYASTDPNRASHPYLPPTLHKWKQSGDLSQTHQNP